MTYLGIEGSLSWAFEQPSGIVSKLTNASPGIVFAIAGFLLCWRTYADKETIAEWKNPGGSNKGTFISQSHRPLPDDIILPEETIKMKS